VVAGTPVVQLRQAAVLEPEEALPLVGARRLQLVPERSVLRVQRPVARVSAQRRFAPQRAAQSPAISKQHDVRRLAPTAGSSDNYRRFSEE
jgi:hypothetical protein